MSWSALEQELDLWRAGGRRVTLWCRDDDACRDSPALRRLLVAAGAHAVPIAIAAVPAALEPSLGGAVARCPLASVVQHGYAHRNHAPQGERSCELGPHRPVESCVDELVAGRDTLARTFGERFLPVLVPPWNRIDPAIVAALPHAGFRGLSTFGPRDVRARVPGLVQSNAHVDLVAWRRGRSFIGEARAFELVVEHLEARREGRADAGEATGILTHHLDLTEGAWTFLEVLFARTRAHPAVEWLGAGAVFAAEGTYATPVTCARSA